MLYQETVAAGTLDLIRELMKEKKLDNFNLVGGTALALQLGHRVSIDIDLFSRQPFDADLLATHLKEKYGGTIKRARENSFQCRIGNVSVDIMSHQYLDVKPPVIIENIRMALLEDIAAMKFNVITREPTRLKDFVDIYYLLEKRSLNDLTSAYMTKYPNVTQDMANRSLLYHQEIDTSVPINLIKQGAFEFQALTMRLNVAVLNPQKIFLPRPNKITFSKWDELPFSEGVTRNNKRKRGKRL